MNQIVTDICAHCGRKQDEHCIFEPVGRPAKCKCYPLVWDDPTAIPGICEQFQSIVPGSLTALCRICFHERECHVS